MKTLVSLMVFLSGSMASAYEMKIITTSAYSKPWLAIYESAAVLSDPALLGRVHFHGFTQDPKTGKPFSEYDFPWADATKIPSNADFKHFVEAYGFQREILYYPHHLVLIPIARGHCDQYVELHDNQKFDAALAEVLQKLGVKETQFRLAFASAHSGGGEVLSRLMEANGKYFSRVERADLYDSLYSDEATTRVKNWILNPAIRELRLFSIPGQEPGQRGDSIFGSLAGVQKVIQKTFRGLSIQERVKTFLPSSRAKIVQETGQKLNHWTLVKTFWVY